MSTTIKSLKQLRVYQASMDAHMIIYDLAGKFPASERYRVTDQILRSQSAVGALICEAWRRRRYPNAFVNKLNESEGEAAETQHWLEVCRRRKYVVDAQIAELDAVYEQIQRQLVSMINHLDDWVIKPTIT